MSDTRSISSSVKKAVQANGLQNASAPRAPKFRRRLAPSAPRLFPLPLRRSHSILRDGNLFDQKSVGMGLTSKMMAAYNDVVAANNRPT